MPRDYLNRHLAPIGFVRVPKSEMSPSWILSSTGTNNANYRGLTLDPQNTTEVGAFAGSPGPYGAFDQNGNVREWIESTFRLTDKGVLGGSFSEDSGGLAASDNSGSNTPPTWEVYEKGFRIAEVPEPSSLMMLMFIGSVGLSYSFLGERERG
jgi:hypothetical protein